ncbi:MAG: LysR substrate-binding domain-containing protein [Candidatus Ventricola sp.]
MDTIHLSRFLVLCRTLNYTEAANASFISRQAMRQIVQRLEEEYGVSLVENRRNRLALTPAGELLRDKAQRVVDEYEDLEASMRSFAMTAEPLRVGVSESLLPFYAPELVASLDRFPDAYPGIRMEQCTMPADALLEGLSAGRLDAALLVDMEPSVLPFRRTVLQRDPLRLMLSSSHPLAERKSVRLIDLEGMTLELMSNPHACFAPLAQALEHAGVHVRFQQVTNYLDVIAHLREGQSIVVDREDVTPLPRSNPYRLLPLEDINFTLCTTLLTASEPSAAAQQLCACLAGEWKGRED